MGSLMEFPVDGVLNVDGPDGVGFDVCLYVESESEDESERESEHESSFRFLFCFRCSFFNFRIYLCFSF